MEKLGTEYGGWHVPINMELNENSIVYSAGVGEDISFDILLQKKYNCKIFLIDPTVKSIKHYSEVIEYYNSNKTINGNIQKDYYSCIENSKPNFEKMSYIDIGLWKENTILKFYKQTNENYVSQSLIDNMFGESYDIVKVDSIKNIMKLNNHSEIELLKLDIEGAEVVVLEQMLNDNIHPKIICVEFDLLLKNKDENNDTLKIIDKLKGCNYSILTNDNWNITFVKHNS
jgi:FkbM family methyltransferase